MADTPISDKVAYVKSQGQSRTHTCHWTGCTRQVPPAMWGCKTHWYKLPLAIRRRIWRCYQPGQEVTQTPSREYIDAAREAEAWIATQQRPAPDDLFAAPKGGA
jgi:hypothetical protein